MKSSFFPFHFFCVIFQKYLLKLWSLWFSFLLLNFLDLALKFCFPRCICELYFTYSFWGLIFTCRQDNISDSLRIGDLWDPIYSGSNFILCGIGKLLFFFTQCATGCIMPAFLPISINEQHFYRLIHYRLEGQGVIITLTVIIIVVAYYCSLSTVLKSFRFITLISRSSL